MAKQNFDASLYSLVIYQNEAFVDGLYQALHGGKIDTSIVEDSKSKTKAGGVEITGGANVAVLGKGLKVNADGKGSVEAADGSKTTQTMSYSQAYYLHKVREQFHQNNAVKRLEKSGDFIDVASGDFIEFRATFEKNDLVSMLDMVTPQIGGVIGYMMYTKDKTGTDFDQNQANGQFELGKSVVEALHKEFRNETSSEYYGKLLDKQSKDVDITSVIICDKKFFANEDSDRILDGEFAVFGKVVSKSSNGLSKFERNKLLKRIKSEGKDWLVAKISEQKDLGKYIDTDISFDIEGNVLRVIPIAIYS